jgi:hypothetical protein
VIHFALRFLYSLDLFGWFLGQSLSREPERTGAKNEQGEIKGIMASKPFKLRF